MEVISRDKQGFLEVPLTTIPAGVTSLVIVTVQLVAVFTPNTARLLSAQFTVAEPFHHVAEMLLQLPLPSYWPVNELLASQASAPPVAGVVAQLEALADELLIRLVATTE